MKKKISLAFTIIITLAFIFWTGNLIAGIGETSKTTDPSQLVFGHYWWWFTTTAIVVIERWTNLIVDVIENKKRGN